MIATVSSAEKADRARAGGAEHVINYRNEDVGARVLDITDGVGVDHIAEVDFGGNLTAALRCLRVNGSIMIYATNGDREPRVPIRYLMQKNLSVYSMSLAGVPHPDRRRAQSDIVKGFRMPASHWRDGMHGGRRPKTLNDSSRSCQHDRRLKSTEAV